MAYHMDISLAGQAQNLHTLQHLHTSPCIPTHSNTFTPVTPTICTHPSHQSPSWCAHTLAPPCQSELIFFPFFSVLTNEWLSGCLVYIILYTFLCKALFYWGDSQGQIYGGWPGPFYPWEISWGKVSLNKLYLYLELLTCSEILLHTNSHGQG